jgi:uncharacterized protein YcbK (DUF882 family)
MLSRRSLLLGLAGSATLLPLTPLQAATAARRREKQGAERWLELVSLHTGESVTLAYRSAAGLVQGSLARLQHLLRDHRNGAQHPMDAGLYDQLADYAELAGVDARFEIISGYRSPASNATLHERSDGVAVKSLHLEGRAMDVRLRGVSCLRLAELARAQQRGGVGYYAKSAFVHVDTGRVRTWNG